VRVLYFQKGRDLDAISCHRVPCAYNGHVRHSVKESIRFFRSQISGKGYKYISIRDNAEWSALIPRESKIREERAGE
jgi:hypothetical protein